MKLEEHFKIKSSEIKTWNRNYASSTTLYREKKLWNITIQFGGNQKNGQNWNNTEVCTSLIKWKVSLEWNILSIKSHPKEMPEKVRVPHLGEAFTE